MAGKTFKLLGQVLERGKKHSLSLPVATMSTGADLLLPINVVVGEREGPRLIAVFCQHGDECLPLHGWFDLFNELNPLQIEGEVIALPAASPLATQFKMRNSLLDALGGDHGNMNRAWPGKSDGWLTERITFAIEREILSGADCVIDFHDGSAGGLHIYYSYLPSGESAVARESARLAAGFGMEILISKSLSYKGTLTQYLTEKDVPNIGVEIGWFFGFDRSIVRTPDEVTRTGICNVMKLLGMMEGEPILPTRQAIVYPETRVKSEKGGLYLSRVTKEDIGQIYSNDHILFEIVDIRSQEIVESARGPFESNMLLTSSPNAVFVNPGDQCCHVADATTLDWIFNEEE